MKFENWVNYMSKLLDVMNCPDGMRVRLTSFYLEGTTDMVAHYEGNRQAT